MMSRVRRLTFGLEEKETCDFEVLIYRRLARPMPPQIRGAKGGHLPSPWPRAALCTRTPSPRLSACRPPVPKRGPGHVPNVTRVRGDKPLVVGDLAHRGPVLVPPAPCAVWGVVVLGCRRDRSAQRRTVTSVQQTEQLPLHHPVSNSANPHCVSDPLPQGQAGFQLRGGGAGGVAHRRGPTRRERPDLTTGQIAAH